MENKLAKVIKFPTKAQRKRAREKLFSLNSVIEIVRVTVGVALAEILMKYLGRFL